MGTSDAHAEYIEAVRQYKLGKIDDKALLESANTMRAQFNMAPLTSITGLPELLPTPASASPQAPQPVVNRKAPLSPIVVTTIVIGVLFIAAAIVINNKGKSPQFSATAITATPQAIYAGEETPASICGNMQSMTSAQWMDYSLQLKGKRIDHWTGWVIDVAAGFDKADVDVSAAGSALTDRQAVFTLPHDQAVSLKKDQRVDFAGTLLGAIDQNGVCAIAFQDAHLLNP